MELDPDQLRPYKPATKKPKAKVGASSTVAKRNVVMSEQYTHSYITFTILNYCNFLKFMCFDEFCERIGDLRINMKFETKKLEKTDKS